MAGELDTDRIELLMFVYGVVEPQFTADQYGALALLHGGAIDRVLKALIRISGMDTSALEVAKRKFLAAT